MAIALTPTQVLTGKVRFSFLKVFEPEPNLSGVMKYSVMLLIPKTDLKTVNDIKAAYKVAFDKGVEKLFKGGKPVEFGTVLRDGDVEYRDPNSPNGIMAGKEMYKGMYFLSASADKYKSKQAALDAAKAEAAGKDVSGYLATPPAVYGPDGTPLMCRTDIYSGCYGRAFINLYPFAAGGNKGVACGLNGVKLTEQGESLSGTGNAAAVFGDIEDDEI